MKRLMVMILFALLSTACEKTLFEPEPAKDPESLFEQLWTSFDENYANFHVRGVNWDEVYTTYRPQIGPETTETELLGVFKQMLGTLQDGHVKLVTPLEKKVFVSNSIMNEKIGDELYDPDLVRSIYLNGNYTVNGDDANTFGKIGKIGYLHLEWVHDNMFEFDNILNTFSDTDGLIIDIRHNRGGDFTYALSEMGRLTNENRFVFRSKTKSGPDRDEYTDWYYWNLNASGTYFDKPIVLITDRHTISAADRLAMILKVLPNVVHVGETTNGAFSTMIGMELANGWIYTISPQKVEFADGVDYEGKGMSPDIQVKNTIEELNNGVDRILETALDQFK